MTNIQSGTINKITGRLFDDHLNRIFIYKTTKGKDATHFRAVQVFKYIHNIIRKGFLDIVRICYDSIARSLKVCSRTVSNTIKYLVSLGVINVFQEKCKINGLYKTVTHVSIDYQRLISYYKTSNIKVMEIVETYRNRDTNIDHCYRYITNKCTDLYNSNKQSPKNKKNHRFYFTSTGGKIFPSINDKINKDRSIPNNKSSEEIHIKENNFIVKNKNASRKLLAIENQLRKNKISLVEFEEKTIFEAVKSNTDKEIRIEEVRNVIIDVFNKYNPIFRHKNQVAKYILKTIDSKKRLENCKSCKTLDSIEISQSILERVNEFSKRSFNITAANRLLKRLKDNQKYKFREFANENAFISYMSKVFAHEKYSEEYLGREQEKHEKFDKVLKIKEMTATTDTEKLLKRLSYILDLDKMSYVLENIILKYDSRSNECNVIYKDQSQELHKDLEFESAIIHASSWLSMYRNSVCKIEYIKSESLMENKYKPFEITEVLKSKGYFEDDNTNLKVLESIRHCVNDENSFRTWLSKLRILASNEEMKIKVCAQNGLIKKWIDNYYIEQISSAVQGAIGIGYSIEVVSNN